MVLAPSGETDSANGPGVVALLIGPAGWTVSRGYRGKGKIMDEDTFQRRLAELVAEIGTLPPGERGKLETLAEQTKQRHKELRQTVNNLHESIDFLRLSIKYLLFDLEATRRENGHLRKMLEEEAGP